MGEFSLKLHLAVMLRMDSHQKGTHQRLLQWPRREMKMGAKENILEACLHSHPG